MSDKPAKKTPTRTRVQARPLEFDYGSSEQLPAYVQEIIQAQLAIEAEDARRAGSLGFMARAMVLATMPYRDPKTDVYKRQNGDFHLRILAGYEGGVPYGVYPRLLLSWITTEAVRTKSRELELGDSLTMFLRNVLDLRSRSGGERGASTRVSDQMARLFGAQVTATYTGNLSSRGIRLKNISVAEEMDLSDEDARRLDSLEALPVRAGAGDGQTATPPEDDLWLPQRPEEAGRWKSVVRLTPKFFAEAIENPVPIDLRAYKALRGSVMAMDIYAWLTHRMAYTTRTTRPIPWASLKLQFGSGLPDDDQGRRDFKKAFLRNLKLVLTVYPAARVDVSEAGLVLHPSPTSVPLAAKQTALF